MPEALVAFFKALSGSDGEAWDRKVLPPLLEPDGGVRQFPLQRKKFEVFLRWAAHALEFGVEYHELELNTILKRSSDDTATLRRGMIEHGILGREAGGARYWRVDTPGGSRPGGERP